MDSLFGLLAPHKSASVDRSQKLLDNGQTGNNRGRLTGRKSDYRFFEFEYPWTSDTEFAHKIELKGSGSIQCSGSTNE